MIRSVEEWNPAQYLGNSKLKQGLQVEDQAGPQWILLVSLWLETIPMDFLTERMFDFLIPRWCRWHSTWSSAWASQVFRDLELDLRSNLYLPGDVKVLGKKKLDRALSEFSFRQMKAALLKKKLRQSRAQASHRALTSRWSVWRFSSRYRRVGAGAVGSVVLANALLVKANWPKLTTSALRRAGTRDWWESNTWTWMRIAWMPCTSGQGLSAMWG